MSNSLGIGPRPVSRLVRDMRKLGLVEHSTKSQKSPYIVTEFGKEWLEDKAEAIGVAKGGKRSVIGRVLDADGSTIGWRVYLFLRQPLQSRISESEERKALRLEFESIFGVDEEILLKRYSGLERLRKTANG
jgi:hypothetical protein